VAQIPIFVINMARDVERMASMRSQLDRLGLPFERFEAVDGRLLDAEQKKALYSDFWYRLIHGRSATNGEIGVSLSHRKIYQKMLDNKIEWAIIFEDDVLLLPQLASQLEEIESSTRDFDMVQLFSFRQPECELRRVASGRFEIKTFRNYHASSAAYLLRLSGAKKLLRIGKVRALSDRWCWLSAMSGLRCCAISPFPVALDDALSGNSSVLQIGKESSPKHFTKHTPKKNWRILVLPWLNLVKVGILRARRL
jgi:glycosyl transferase, family 25